MFRNDKWVMVKLTVESPNNAPSDVPSVLEYILNLPISLLAYIRDSEIPVEEVQEGWQQESLSKIFSDFLTFSENNTPPDPSLPSDPETLLENDIWKKTLAFKKPAAAPEIKDLPDDNVWKRAVEFGTNKVQKNSEPIELSSLSKKNTTETIDKKITNLFSLLADFSRGDATIIIAPFVEQDNPLPCKWRFTGINAAAFLDKAITNLFSSPELKVDNTNWLILDENKNISLDMMPIETTNTINHITLQQTLNEIFKFLNVILFDNSLFWHNQLTYSDRFFGMDIRAEFKSKSRNQQPSMPVAIASLMIKLEGLELSIHDYSLEDLLRLSRHAQKRLQLDDDCKGPIHEFLTIIATLCVLDGKEFVLNENAVHNLQTFMEKYKLNDLTPKVQTKKSPA